MVDAEIIKALKCCGEEGKCGSCPYHESNCKTFERDVLDLINRQQEEIERYKHSIKLLKEDVADAKSRAIKEFAERLKESLDGNTEPIDDYDIDELVKEMVEK